MNIEQKWFECHCDCHRHKEIVHVVACCHDMCRICGKHIGGDALAFEAHTKSHGFYNTLPIPHRG